MWLGSGIAVAVVLVGSYSSDSTPSLGTSLCHRCDPKKTEKKKKDMEVSYLFTMLCLIHLFHLAAPELYLFIRN